MKRRFNNIEKRAKAGQGRARLTRQAREVTRSHILGYFTANGNGWQARCQTCHRMVIIRPDRVEVDGGIGGTATKTECDNRYRIPGIDYKTKEEDDKGIDTE